MSESSKLKRGGRYHRSEWTQYHNRLAQISEKDGEKERHEKVVKLTELLRKREIISERNQETMAGSDLNKNQMSEEESDTEASNKMDLVGNFCTEETNKQVTNGDTMTSEIEAIHVPDGTVPSTVRTSRTDETGNTNTKPISDEKQKLRTQLEISDKRGKSNLVPDDKATLPETGKDSMIWEYAAEETENTSETQSVPSPVKIKQESIQIAIKGNSMYQSETGMEDEQAVPKGIVETDRFGGETAYAEYKQKDQISSSDRNENTIVWLESTAGVIDLVDDTTNSSSVNLSMRSEDAQESSPLQPDNAQVNHRRQRQKVKTTNTTTNYGRTKLQNQSTNLETADKCNNILSNTDKKSQIEKDNMIWEYAEKHSALMTQQEPSYVNGTNLVSRSIEGQGTTNDGENDRYRAKYEMNAQSGAPNAKNNSKFARDRQEWDTHTNCLDTDIEYIDSDEEIENSSSKSSTDKSTDESDDDMEIADIMEDLMPTTKWQSNVEESSPLSKRKSYTYNANKNPKRAHLTQAAPVTDSPVQHNTAYANNETDQGLTILQKSKQENQTNTDNNNNKRLSGYGKESQSANERPSGINNRSTKQSNHERSSSDAEWEEISRKIKSTPTEQRNGSERKMQRLTNPMDMKKKAQF